MGPGQRQRAADFVALMTPVVKAMFTDLGLESASLAVQCYGGHGYIRESGVEQYMRDARIAMLYEGTNGIQALDLVGHKMPAIWAAICAASSIRCRLSSRQQRRPEDEADDRGLAKAFGALQLSTATVARRRSRIPKRRARRRRTICV
jgi:hypothetical protein